MSSTVTESARGAPSADGMVTPDDTPPRAKSLEPLRQLLGFLWPHKGRLIGASVALVFTAGAQLTHKNRKKLTAMEYAHKSKNKELISFLEAKVDERSKAALD